VTGHHHSGTTLLGSHIASTHNCALVWEPLNPTTSYYRFSYSVGSWFLNPYDLDSDDLNIFRDAFSKAISFTPVPPRSNVLRDLKDILKCTKYAGLSIYSKLAGMRPVVKDPISLFAIDFYQEYDFDVIVVIKKPENFVASEITRGNRPPWHDLYKRLRIQRWSSEVELLLENSLKGHSSLDLQHALFWYCSVISTNLINYDQTLATRQCLINFEDYSSNQPLHFRRLCQTYNLFPSSSSEALTSNSDLSFYQRIDGCLRGFSFSYTSRKAKRSSQLGVFEPSTSYNEFYDKYLDPLLSALNWNSST